MSKALFEKKNDLVTRGEEILNRAKAEVRELTEAEANELAEIKNSVLKIKELLETDKDFKELSKEDKAAEPDKGDDAKDGERSDVEEQETRAFEAHIRNIVMNERDNNLTKSANGSIIPQTILNRIITKVYDICPILEKSSKYNVKGKLTIPYYNEDEDNRIEVAYHDEFDELTSNAGNFMSIELDGYLAGALTKVSRSLINNSQFNLVDFVVDRMAYAIKRFIEKELLNGTTGKVEGLSTLDASVTAAAATAVTSNEIIELHDSIIDDFQDGAMWVMSRKTRTALRELKDDYGHYLLNDDISSPFGKVLLGKPVYVSDNMPEMESGNTAIYYGNFTGLATKFVEEMSIEVLRELFATQHAVGVVAWLEFDSKVEDAQKLGKLVMG